MGKLDFKLNQEEALVKIGNWNKADVITLGNHFHGRPEEGQGGLGYNPTSDQRVDVYYLDFDQMLNENENEWVYDHFIVHMALLNHISIPGTLTYLPVLQLGTKAVIPPINDYYKFLPSNLRAIRLAQETPTPINPNENGIQPVPFSYLNQVERSWNHANVAMIDDYLCVMRSGKLERVKKTEFSQKRNNNFYRLLKTVYSSSEWALRYFGLHLGVDLNKEIDRSQATYTPVFELAFNSILSSRILLESINFNKKERDLFKRIIRESGNSFNLNSNGGDTNWKSLKLKLRSFFIRQLLIDCEIDEPNDLVFIFTGKLDTLPGKIEDEILISTPVSGLFQFAQLCPPWCEQ